MSNETERAEDDALRGVASAMRAAAWESFHTHEDPGRSESPPDEVKGGDPTISVASEAMTAFRHRCGGCTYVLLSEEPNGLTALADHIRWGHPAYRNPDLSCQATPPWDHDRWCVRAKGHDGEHWTPSTNGGMGWSQ